MFDLLNSMVRPLSLNTSILGVTYKLDLQAPQEASPTIDLRSLPQKTAKNLLDCRNAIVAANRLGRFPDCKLRS